MTLSDTRSTDPWATLWRWRYFVALCAFALIGSLYAVLTDGAAPPPSDIPAAGSAGERQTDDDKYEQTWPKSYSSTTCHEWNAEMTADQRWAAAADMLTGARNKGDGGQGLPPDSMVDEFMGGVTRACVIPEMSLAEVGAGLYLTERARFRP